MAQTANTVALITGANKGIGLEIARQLGKQGITVIIGARDPHKGEETVAQLKAEGIDAQTVKLEVSNHDDIAALPAWFEQNTGRLDILVNNAGVFPDLQGATPQGFRDGYETNVIAPYFLTQTLLPLLKASPAGRIVNHSSALGSLTLNGSGQIPNEWLAPIYNSSKAALNMLTVIQAALLKDTPIKVNAAHPGSVLTDMNAQGGLTVEQGAQTAVRLATLPDDGPTGGFFHFNETLPW
jgi:NAD(P)-dependent dehydrogenase (short-subunit alcohol dehydrogenase family)